MSSRLVTLALLLVTSPSWAGDVRGWLDRMYQAVEHLSYEGTFVHVQGGNAESLHIVHRNEGGVISERIVSLDGAGREIIRHGDVVQSILPDRGVVLLKESEGGGSMLSTMPAYLEDFEPYYELTLYRTARVAKREAQVVGIKPLDSYRYGYLLWLDTETAMPLKSQIRDENDQILEQILFTQLEILDSVPDSLLRPTVDTEGFTWYRPAEWSSERAVRDQWHAKEVPDGFRLAISQQSLLAGAEYPVHHLVYSDGLATVSVFVEDPNNTTQVAEGFSTVGSTNAFSLTVDGRRVTAVGEVPRQTVRTIATSLSSR
jgi:sigma-E factor negative regulatory protein RseB